MSDREHIVIPISGEPAGSSANGAVPTPNPEVRLTGAHFGPTTAETRPSGVSSPAASSKPKAVIGVYVGRRPRAGRRRPFGSETARLARMIRLGTQKGLVVFVFSHDQVNWKRKQVRGLTRTDASVRPAEWVEQVFPLPDVVYDRIPSRRAEQRTSVQETKKALQRHYEALYFNPGYFDKWQVHKLLAKTRLSRRLPETRRFHKFKGFRTMLHRYGGLFLKPTKGSQGKGIFVVSKARGGYTVRRTNSITGSSYHYKSAIALYGALRRRIGRRPYVIQPNLHLARWGGRPFDVRILMQKDGKGEWQRTKMYARVAARGALTSNISMGGVGLPLPKLLPSIFGRRSAAIFRKCKKLGGRIARAVEEAMGTQLGEIGIDLGISKRGRVWLIEVNSKPFRKLTTKRGTMEQVRQSLVRPLEYAAYLATRSGDESDAPVREAAVSNDATDRSPSTLPEKRGV